MSNFLSTTTNKLVDMWTSWLLEVRSSPPCSKLAGTWAEATTGQVDISDIEFEVFKELLHYIYSGRIEKPLTQEMAQSLFVAADKYEIVDLKDECSEIVISNMKIENAISLMIWSYTHSFNRVLMGTFSTAAQYKEKICQKEEWKTLLLNFPDLCIQATQRMMTQK